MTKFMARAIAGLLVFVCAIFSFGAQAMAYCPYQEVSLAINASFTTDDLSSTSCGAQNWGLYLSPGLSFTNLIPQIATSGSAKFAQTVTTTNATYLFSWNGIFNDPSYKTDGKNTYTIKLLSVGHNASPDVASGNDLGGATGADYFVLYGYQFIGQSGAIPVTFAIGLTVPVPVPTIASVSPNIGSSSGGTSVIITGTNFDTRPGYNSVRFGTTSATVTAASPTSLTVTSPVHAAGIVDTSVRVNILSSVTSFADRFTYITCPTQKANLAIGGNFKTDSLWTSCNDTNDMGLFLDNRAISQINSNRQLAGQTVKTTNATYAFHWHGIAQSSPLAASLDTYTIDLVSVGHNASPDVVSTNDLGGAAGTDKFNLYNHNGVVLISPIAFAITIPATPVPTVTSISPFNGLTAGGTTVTITGSNFDATPANNTVKFGTTAATVAAATATSLTVTSPALVFGGYHVTVQTTAGTSAI